MPTSVVVRKHHSSVRELINRNRR
jgi:hypothetical protein